ncbi:MAG: holo-ACP synthase [Eubacteriales bacterium]
MIYGIGTDIMCIDKLNEDFLKDDDPFLLKTFSDAEIAESKLRGNSLVYFAVRFAGKEAVFKTLNWDGSHCSFSDIEILNKANGTPYVVLGGKIKNFAKDRGIKKISVSLSYDNGYALAYAIAEK